MLHNFPFVTDFVLSKAHSSLRADGDVPFSYWLNFLLVLDVDLNTFQLLPSPNGTGEHEIDSGGQISVSIDPIVPLCGSVSMSPPTHWCQLIVQLYCPFDVNCPCSNGTSATPFNCFGYVEGYKILFLASKFPCNDFVQLHFLGWIEHRWACE